MTELTRGANAALPARRVTATVSCAAPADVSALLVGPDLRVRSDADLVFFNAPQAPGVRWSGAGQRVELDLDAVEAAAVLIAVSLTGTATFGTIPPPRLALATADGAPVAEFTVPGLGPERAIIGLEIYRRADQWKVRAVGQGYAGGLAELVAAHGIEVDDPGDPEPASPPPPAAVPPVSYPHLTPPTTRISSPHAVLA
ncbi:TerD family protein, partial [Actinomadura sp. BRA 177]|uniref:TerD family protein n=1 Tax=Actinomadura sp. BRA 177 TaxID=2745202 RepID=UPI0015950F2B